LKIARTAVVLASGALAGVWTAAAIHSFSYRGIELPSSPAKGSIEVKTNLQNNFY
jgi:hypothetical protein